MKIHEFQAKQILSQYGVAIPRGEVADTADIMESLMCALAAFAVQEIRWYAIAEALLRDAGKWKTADPPTPEASSAPCK